MFPVGPIFLFITSLISSAVIFYRYLDDNYADSAAQVLNASISEELPAETPPPSASEPIIIREMTEQNTETATPSPTPTKPPASKPKKNTPTPSQTVAPSVTSAPTPTITVIPTPTQSPAPTVPPTTSSLQPQFTSAQINGFIDRFAGQYGVDPNVLRYIALCESGFRADAVNGPYAGLYQYSQSTWINNRVLIGEDTNPDLRFNAEEAVQTAAYMVSAGKSYVWPNCTP